MGYAFYFISAGRPAGYGVLATCDKRGCDTAVDRGMGFLCGDTPGGDERGCGRYFCGDHLGFVGERGGCAHRRQRRAWGRTLTCMAVHYNDRFKNDYCLYRAGHGGAHAWADEDAT